MTRFTQVFEGWALAWLLRAMLATWLTVAAPSFLAAAPLAVSGTPRTMNSLAATAAWCCMNPVASGGAGSYRWDFASNPGNNFSIDATSGAVAPVRSLTNGSYALSVRVTDLLGSAATSNVVISVVGTGIVAVACDTIFDNYDGNGWFGSLGIFATNFVNGSSANAWTIVDPSGHFYAESTYNYLCLAGTVPPAGDYPITLSVTQGGKSMGPFPFTVHVAAEPDVTNIVFSQNVISTSCGAGVAAGTASAIVYNPNYSWSIPAAQSDGYTFTIANAASPVVTLLRAPAAGDRSIVISVQDGLNAYSQTCTVHVVTGNLLPATNLSLLISTNLDNYTSSGVLGTATVFGVTGTPAWSITGDGAGNRYAIDPASGRISIVGVLSYNPTINGVDYSDLLSVTCTDGSNTCIRAFHIPVAACVGPVLNVGPGQTYSNLNAAIAYCHAHGWGRPFAGVTFNVFPSSDPNYYRNDGQWYPINGNFPVPVTIQGAPGQTFPRFQGNGLYYAKGFFMSYNYDLWVRNVEIFNVSAYDTGSGNDNLTAVAKEAGCVTGNLFLDNFYIHDCDDGIARGNAGTKWFITNGRVSHCGVGETGYTHNLYLLGGFAYVGNILTDQSTVGHTFKSRCARTLIENCRIFDGEMGHGSINIDLPEGGVNLVRNVLVQKGPNFQNGWSVHFAEPGDSHGVNPTHHLDLDNSTLLADVAAVSIGNVFAAVDYSLIGPADGIPASITMTNNAFCGYQSANYEYTGSRSGGPLGATSVSGSAALPFQPPLDYTFPGAGPDPTLANPPGPFITPYGVVGGPQIVVPVADIRMPASSTAGTVVVSLTWLPGNSGATAPTFALSQNPGSRYAIDPSNGIIRTAAALITNLVDVVQVKVSQSGHTFWQFGVTSADGAFLHSLYIVAADVPPPVYAILASAGPGGTIAPSGTLAATASTSRVFAIAPSNGFEIADLQVDGLSVGATAAYTLANIQTNHTLAARFSPITNAPSITSPLAATGMLGVAFSYVITATHVPTGFAATGLPGGLSVDPATGVISGAPTAAGTWAVAISATNVCGGSTQTLAMTIGCTIASSAGPGGSIAPSGNVVVVGGGSQSFVIAAGAYFVTGDVLVDGGSVGTVPSFTFSNVTTNHTIAAAFTALLAPKGTPQWWLAQYGWSNNFAAAELADPDGDGVVNWMEWLAGTNPTNPLSRPDYNTVPYAESFENLAGWNGVYTHVYGYKGWFTSDPGYDLSGITNLVYVLSSSNQPLPSATHTNVLRVDTEGAVLSNSFGTGFDMSGVLTYVDMAVQWGPGDISAATFTTNDTGIKCGVYANASNTLMVYHGVADSAGRLLSNAVDAVASLINPTNWCRLTIVIDTTAANSNRALAMFQVKLNGAAISSAAAYGDGWRAQFNDSGVLPATVPGGTWFRLATTNGFAKTLTSIDLQGRGYLDDLVVTNGDPFAVWTVHPQRGAVFIMR